MITSPTESLIHQLKIGTVLNHKYETQRKLERAISSWVNYYNYKQIRQSNNWLTPIEMRKNMPNHTIVIRHI
ncbi:IS3 family transposase [Companilactobacillus metriopterae]|uniref:IS3 family transposase n=1 Tax=Companilactobacillus metriopterae TaxID=1909267 RepID=UPI00100BA4BE